MKPNEKTTRDVIAITAAVAIVGVANITLSYVGVGGIWDEREVES